jgi:acyl carrier protein
MSTQQQRPAGGERPEPAAGGGAAGAERRTVEEIEHWLVGYLSRVLAIEEPKISTTTSFARYGLDSSAGIALTSDLSDWLGREVDPTINYSYPTIAALARHLAG